MVDKFDHLDRAQAAVFALEGAIADWQRLWRQKERGPVGRRLDQILAAARRIRQSAEAIEQGILDAANCEA